MAVSGKERKGIYLALMIKRRIVSPIKKHETALTHYLGQITEKQMV